MTMLYFMGIGFIAITLADCLYCRNIIANGIKVEAVVYRTEKVNNNDPELPGYSYHPVFQYIIGEKQYETRYSTGNKNPEYSDGATVQIYCHKKNPRKIMLPDDKTRKFIHRLFFAIGGVIFCIAVFISYITV